jgi:hypothetical protein
VRAKGIKVRGLLRLVAILAVLAPACASVRPADRLERVAIEVRELPASDRWRVSWSFERPTLGLTFVRSREPFRSRTWSIVAPRNARWIKVDGRDVVLLDKPARTVTAELVADSRPLGKDYELVVPFTDGGRLLYTGHLHAVPMEPCPSCSNRVRPRVPCGPPQFTFVTDPNRNVRVLQSAGVGRLAWEPVGRPAVDGTYVYFGATQPVAAARMTLLADQGMPRWLLRSIEAELPRLFDFFAELTGTPLDFTPLLLLSFRPTSNSGRSFTGGALEGLVQIAAVGQEWRDETDEARRLWLRQVAHEAFHLWDGQLAVPVRDAEWLSEGAAEYASRLALRDRGLVDEAGLQRLIVEQANDCLVAAGGTSILAAPSSGRFDAMYSCGMITQFLADRGARAAGERSGITALYRSLFAATGTRGGGYDTALFLDLVRRLAPSSLGAIEALVSRGVPRNADVFLRNALTAAGLAVELADPYESTANQATLRYILRGALRRCACANPKADHCAAIAEVTSVAGIPVRSRPGEAFTALQLAIADGEPVQLWWHSRREDGHLCCGPEALDPTFTKLLRLVPSGTPTSP